MNIKQSILVIFTIIFLLLSIVFIGFEAIEIPKDQNALIDSILEKITPEVRSGRLNPRTLNTLPPNTFYAIWVEDDYETWQPIIVTEGVTIRVQDGPTWIPQEYAWAARTYLKTSDNINYIVWINKYNPEFYIKNVIIVALFLLLFYLILVLVISVLFGNKHEDIYNDDDNDEDLEFSYSTSDKIEQTAKTDTGRNKVDEKKTGKEDEKSSADDFSTAKNDNQDSADEQKSSGDDLSDNNIKEANITEQKSSGDEKNATNNRETDKNNEETNKSDDSQEGQKSSGDDFSTAKNDNQDSAVKQKSSGDDLSDNNIKEANTAEQKSSGDETEIVYEHTIGGDDINKPTGVKLTSEEYNALTQPIDYDDEDIDIDISDPFYMPEPEMPNMPAVRDLQTEAQKRTDAIINKYKELWNKSIKMSDDFRNNFKFREIRNLQKLGITPSQYIDSVLKTGQDYFEWDSCNIYICQDSKLINAVTNEVYDNTNLDIPTKGTNKGLQFIPLFPYNNDDIFGYLAFEWNSIKPFRLTDILCYLMLIFANDTKFILDNELQNNIKTDIQNALKAKGDTLLAILTVDNKERIKLQYTDEELSKLDEMIYNKIRKNYKKYISYHITSFKYAIIGAKINKEKSVAAFDKWISNADKHVYSITPMNNIAISFSCGIAYKSDTVGSNSTAENMIDRAENLLAVSVNKGGNKITIQK